MPGKRKEVKMQAKLLLCAPSPHSPSLGPWDSRSTCPGGTTCCSQPEKLGAGHMGLWMDRPTDRPSETDTVLSSSSMNMNKKC